MLTRLATTQVWVHDQDEALVFYTEKLGMEVREDVTAAAMTSPPPRGLTPRSPPRTPSAGGPLVMLASLAHLIVRRRRAVVAVWLALTLFGAYSAGQVSKRWFERFSIPGYSAYEANQR